MVYWLAVALLFRRTMAASVNTRRMNWTEVSTEKWHRQTDRQAAWRCACVAIFSRLPEKVRSIWVEQSTVWIWSAVGQSSENWNTYIVNLSYRSSSSCVFFSTGKNDLNIFDSFVFYFWNHYKLFRDTGLLQFVLENASCFYMNIICGQLDAQILFVGSQPPWNVHVSDLFCVMPSRSTVQILPPCAMLFACEMCIW